MSKRLNKIIVILLILMGSCFLSKLFKKPPRYNVILITLDALRADHLGCYGYQRNTSPNIDRFAKEGIMFTQAISQSSRTSPSISSMLTSLYPDHGLIEEGYSLSVENPNLIGILRKKGYKTALFSGAEPILSITLNNVKDNFGVFYVKDEKSDKTIQRAINWLNNKAKSPFFLWVHIFAPHSPYTPPYHYYSEFISDGLYPHKNVSIAVDDGIRNEHYSFGVIPRYVAENGITDTRYYIARYDGEIKFADEQIGKLLNQLNKLKLESNTLIILCSDHGESMTEHNFYFNHSHFLYEELIRVPLIIVFPNIVPKGKVIPQQVQLIDIMPTIFDLLKIKSGITMEGESLMPLIKSKKFHYRLYAFSESAYWPAPQCIRVSDWKLIHNRKNGNYELYNLKEDPKESNNLIYVEKDKLEFLKQKLVEHIRQAKRHRINKSLLNSDTREKLKSLGYVQ